MLSFLRTGAFVLSDRDPQVAKHHQSSVVCERDHRHRSAGCSFSPVKWLLLVERLQHGATAGRPLPDTEGVDLEQGLPHAL